MCRALTTATQSWQARRKRQLTNCNECWTPRSVWSAVPISSTEACRDSSILSYIGWMFLTASCTNSASWFSTASTVKRLNTSWNCANQSQVSHHGNIFDFLLTYFSLHYCWKVTILPQNVWQLLSSVIFWNTTMDADMQTLKKVFQLIVLRIFWYGPVTTQC